MSKRTKIIIGLVVVILGTGILYFSLRGSGGTSGGSIFSGLPFGTAPEGTTGGTGTEPGEGESGGTGGVALPHFFKLVDTPIAGAVAIIKNGSTIVRYVDRAAGHVYDINPVTLEKTTILNTTLPKVYRALWKPDGSGFVAQTLADNGDTVINTSITLTPPKASSTDSLYTAQNTILRGNVDDVVVTSDNNLVYSLTDSGAISTASFTGEKPKNLYTSTFTEWRLEPTNAGLALLTTKASAFAPGYTYSLNTKTGGLTKILGPLDGLTALMSPDGKRLAFTYTDNNTPKFTALKISSKISLPITPATLPEKCVWSSKIQSIIICGVPTGGLGDNIPDAWYQGETSFVDKIWRFNTDTDTAEILVDPKKNFDTELDAIWLSLSPDEDYLFFVNKNDLSLWALKLQP